MNYTEVKLDLKDEALCEILEAELAEAGFESFVIEGPLLKAYIPTGQLDEASLALVLGSYEDAIAHVEQQTIGHTNWNAVWESSYYPVLIDGSIYIKAPFHPDNPDAEECIILEPNMSFGTGHHPTTHLMLSALKHLDLQNKNVADFGCGSGILAIYASMRGAHGIGVEIDPHAAEAARENLKRNNVTNFEIITGDLKALGHGPYHLILANINRNVIEESLTAFHACTTDDAMLLFAGFLDSDAGPLSKKLAESGFRVSNTSSLKGWTMITTQKTT